MGLEMDSRSLRVFSILFVFISAYIRLDLAFTNLICSIWRSVVTSGCK